MSNGHIHPTSLEGDSGAAFCSFEDSSTSPVMENFNEDANCANNVILVEDNTLDDEVHEEENNPFEKKGRKRTSEVWNDFEEIALPDGTKKYQCKSCKTKFTIHASGVTSHLRRHMKSCLMRRVTIGQENRQKTLSFDPIGSDSGMSLGTFSYDHAKVREAASHMILYHEYPFNKMEHVLFNKFMRVATPYWQKISRATAKNDCISTYELQKKKLKTSLRGVHRIGLTTDLWKSTTQKIQYMVELGRSRRRINILTQIADPNPFPATLRRLSRLAKNAWILHSRRSQKTSHLNRRQSSSLLSRRSRTIMHLMNPQRVVSFMLCLDDDFVSRWIR